MNLAMRMQYFFKNIIALAIFVITLQSFQAHSSCSDEFKALINRTSQFQSIKEQQRQLDKSVEQMLVNAEKGKIDFPLAEALPEVEKMYRWLLEGLKNYKSAVGNSKLLEELKLQIDNEYQSLKSNPENLTAQSFFTFASRATAFYSIALEPPKSISESDDILKRYIDYNYKTEGAVASRFKPLAWHLPTSRDLSIFDINGISGMPIFYLGVAKEKSPADGVTYDPSSFFRHDENHAALAMMSQYSDLLSLNVHSSPEQIKTAAKWLRSEVSKNKKIHSEVFDGLEKASEKEFLGTHLLWFTATHELAMSIDHGIYKNIVESLSDPHNFTTKIIYRDCPELRKYPIEELVTAGIERFKRLQNQ